MDNRNDIKRAFIATLPVFAGYIALGFGFGVLLSVEGFSPWWALFMSVTMFGGSMQYAAVSLMADNVSLVTAAVTTLIINAVCIIVIILLTK